MIARLAKLDDVVPFTQEQTGWEWGQLDLSAVYVVEEDGKIIAALITSVVHKTLLLIRLVSTKEGRYWMRPLFKFVKKDCLSRGISGCWSFFTCQSESEKMLVKLVGHYPKNYVTPMFHSVIGWRWE